TERVGVGSAFREVALFAQALGECGAVAGARGARGVERLARRECADLGAQLEVAPFEPAAERRQVVRDHEPERAARVAGARPEALAVALEAQDAHGQDPPALELRPELGRDGTEIFADDEGPRAPALEPEHAEQLGARLRHVGALAARAA